MIKINLIKDLAELLKLEIKNQEVNIKSLDYYEQIKDSSNIHEICLKYFNLLNRLVFSKPRNIKYSAEFKCPKGYENGLKNIEQIILNGDDLTPYLSRQVKNLDSHDTLLDDWGIYHIHLGVQKKPNDFSQRTGPVLFAKIDKEFAYFIQILDHGGRHEPWFNKNLIKIIHKNWPEIIKNFLLNIDINSVNLSKDIKNWRRAGVNTPIVLNDGTAYISLGGGYVSSMDNIQHKRMTNNIISYIESLETMIKNKINVIKINITGNKMKLPDQLELNLVKFNINKEFKCFIQEKEIGICFIFHGLELKEIKIKK